MHKLAFAGKRTKRPEEKKSRSDARQSQAEGSGSVSVAENKSEHTARSSSRGFLFLGAVLKCLGRCREPSPHAGTDELALKQLPPAVSGLKAGPQNDTQSRDPTTINTAVTHAVANVEGIKESHVAAKVATAIDSAGSALDAIDPLVAPLGALKAFSSMVDAMAEVHPYSQVALSIFKCASKIILDQVKLDNAVHELLSKISQVYEFIMEKEDLTFIPNMQAVLEKLSRQVLDCADFIAHYSETKSFWKRTGRNVLGDTNNAVQGYSGAIDSLMQQFRNNASRDVAIFTYRAAEDLDMSGLEYAGGVGRNTSKQCEEDTRKEILSEVMDWVDDSGPNAEQCDG